MRKIVIASSVVLIALFVAVFAILLLAGESSEPEDTTDTTETTTTSVPKVKPIILETTVPPSTLTTSLATSTTLPGLVFQLNITPEKYYEKDSASLMLFKGDTGVVSVRGANDNKPAGVEIFVDDKPAGFTNEDGRLEIRNLEPGNYTLYAVKDGFSPASLNFSVWKSPYGLSIFVRRMLPESSRDEYISDGKVNVRFYDLPSCAICRVMRPRVSDIVSKNRDCVVYEIISLWKYSEELTGRFIGMTTPIIEIEGPGKSFQTSGMVSSQKLEDMLVKASPGCFGR